MSNILKCNACNIVIDEMLAYILNKLSVIDEDTLMRICTTSFTSDEIKNSKSLLFDSVSSNQPKIQRKGSRKETRDLEDIVTFLKSADAETLPVFVARKLEKLPPIDFDHLDCTKLLRDMSKIQSEIKVIKATYATNSQIADLRTDIHNMKYASLPLTPVCNVNSKRGAWIHDSGPIGLSHFRNSSEEKNDSSCIEHTPAGETVECTYRNNNTNKVNNAETLEYSSMVSHTSQPLLEVLEQLSDERPSAELTYPQLQTSAVSHTSQPLLGVPEQLSDERPSAEPTYPQLQTSNKKFDENDGFQTVTRRKKPNYRFTGKRGTAADNIGKFRSAAKKTPIFISNVHKDTLESDIIKYVKAKTKEVITLEKIDVQGRKNHNAYRFFVNEDKVFMFLAEDLWPQGIIFRKFVHFRNFHSNRNSVSGRNAILNG